MRRTVYRTIFPMLLAFGLAQAATIDVGVLSFDVLIPGAPGAPGVNGFTIGNYTGDPASGGFALPPDFPVTDTLIFQQTAVTLTEPGLTGLPVMLGDLAPGAEQPGSLQFADTTMITSALFAGMLSSTHFQLADGRTFTVTSPDLIATLLPSSGVDLTPGTDFTLISVSGTFAAVSEPGTYLTTALILGALLFYRRRRVQ